MKNASQNQSEIVQLLRVLCHGQQELLHSNRRLAKVHDWWREQLASRDRQSRHRSRKAGQTAAAKQRLRECTVRNDARHSLLNSEATIAAGHVPNPVHPPLVLVAVRQRLGMSQYSPPTVHPPAYRSGFLASCGECAPHMRQQTRFAKLRNIATAAQLRRARNLDHAHVFEPRPCGAHIWTFAWLAPPAPDGVSADPANRV